MGECEKVLFSAALCLLVIIYSWLYGTLRIALQEKVRLRNALDESYKLQQDTITAWRENDAMKDQLNMKLMKTNTAYFERMHYFEKLYYDSQKRPPGDEWKDLLDDE